MAAWILGALIFLAVHRAPQEGDRVTKGQTICIIEAMVRGKA